MQVHAEQLWHTLSTKKSRGEKTIQMHVRGLLCQCFPEKYFFLSVQHHTTAPPTEHVPLITQHVEMPSLS